MSRNAGKVYVGAAKPATVAVAMRREEREQSRTVGGWRSSARRTATESEPAEEDKGSAVKVIVAVVAVTGAFFVRMTLGPTGVGFLC